MVRKRLEDSNAKYEDGLKIIYLYTKGKSGDASQKLCDMLRYIEESTSENAVNEELRNIHKWITEIKQDEEVGVSYMKSWEIEEHIREEGRREEHVEGIRIFVNLCKKLDVPEYEIAVRLSEEYGMSLNEANAYIVKIYQMTE